MRMSRPSEHGADSVRASTWVCRLVALTCLLADKAGTRFMCTVESPIHENIKRKIVESTEQDTVHIFRLVLDLQDVL